MAWLYEPSNSSYSGWASEGVARDLSALAPRLAPQSLAAFANVRIKENSLEYEMPQPLDLRA